MRVEADTKRFSLDRLRVLNAELDAQRLIAIERARAADAKAGFLALTGGIVISGKIEFGESPFAWWVSGSPIVLAVVAVALSVLALRLTTRPSMDPVKQQSAFMARDLSSGTEQAILETLAKGKARDAGEQNRGTERRLRVLGWSFGFLVAALADAVVLFIVSNSIV